MSSCIKLMHAFSLPSSPASVPYMSEETADETLPDAPVISNMITYQESLMREGFVKIAELSPDVIELAWNAYDPQTGESCNRDCTSACTWTASARKCMCMHPEFSVHAHAPRKKNNGPSFDSIKNCGLIAFIFRMDQAYGNGPNLF